MDFYCDHLFETKHSHPKFLNREKFDNELQIYKDQGNIFYNTQRIIWLSNLRCGRVGEEWCYWDFWCLYRSPYTSVMLHWASSYNAYEDVCKEEHPDWSPLDV